MIERGVQPQGSNVKRRDQKHSRLILLTNVPKLLVGYIARLNQTRWQNPLGDPLIFRGGPVEIYFCYSRGSTTDNWIVPACLLCRSNGIRLRRLLQCNLINR